MSDADDLGWLEGSVLIELEPGPVPVIPRALWAQVEEWLLAWKHVEALREAGLDMPGGLLLHGPTGSGKTSLARGILNYMPGRPGVILEAHNVLTQMFGESPRNVARGFELAARHEALMVIEEIDAIGMKRKERSSSEENAKITIALMRCLEGAKIPVIATTNFKEDLDPALLRRFELQLEVPTLDEKGRAFVLKKILGRDPEAELVALPLNESIRMARRLRRCEFLVECERKGVV
jgi:ATP-dependent 26S proteasome regulatory subunit